MPERTPRDGREIRLSPEGFLKKHGLFLDLTLENCRTTLTRPSPVARTVVIADSSPLDCLTLMGSMDVCTTPDGTDHRCLDGVFRICAGPSIRWQHPVAASDERRAILIEQARPWP